MDKVERTLLTIQKPLAWWLWKTNILPWGRKFFKKKYEEITNELKEQANSNNGSKNG